MQISLNIILDVLESYRQEIHVSSGSKLSFSRCLPLPDDTGDMAGDCIYVGGLAKALALRGEGVDICCICLRDRVKDEAETDAALNGLIIINENISPNALLMLVQNRFFAILDWIQQMHETMIHDGSMQDIVDLCAPVIDNYIAVSDSSLMLLAYSRFIPCDDPICVNLVKYGYHPEESIQKFKEYDLFRKWEMADGIYIDDTRTTAKYVALNKIFKFRNVYFAHVVLTCNRKPLTPGMIDLFQMFLDALAVYIERAWEAKSACNHIYDTFLTDLIEGNISSKKVIEERAQYVGIPLTGRYCLFQIISNDSANMSIGKMLMEFSDLFPRFRFIRYQQRIVAINNFFPHDDPEEQLQAICRSLEVFLEKYDALCGVSLFFDALDEIPFSFRQSTLALKYIDRLGRGGTGGRLVLQDEKQSPRINHFSDSYIFCLVGEYEPNAELWYHSDYHAMLRKLHDYDARHKSNTVQILQTYLSLERSATGTGAALNMHRNNVLYHISRIEEMLSVDFDSPSVRFMMLMSFILLELYGFNNE
ncbi:PucR C-terminal helix-turn-helix domain-containing protein [Sporobacter termitidis DSM 10068]|uniref:PucR C-terminal helix-turn-helix domain-containing protein n=1 Tax=Sporobacter termitidis DSM 10068 TaxID=1123282 RepID=A0A1M5XQB2_9FIRM|nr:helix-turn-helix domain-containing protein [Sporobacter termitidis]SHI01980.1 PucR C-terminal helix-turn-helix domain-containing protein [Sporobacter termitidis DSM 10068]